MDKKVFNCMTDFIEKECGIRRSRINIQSRIEEDLRITGTDAVEFIIAFGKKINVDVSNFMAADYFQVEGVNWFMPRYKPNKKILTLSHLVKAVKTAC